MNQSICTSKTLYFIVFLILVNTTASFTKGPTELKNNALVTSAFEKRNVIGSFLLYDYQKKEFSGYDLERCNKGFSPASTFKIPNTLIALETGVITTDKAFKWNGEKRRNTRWEADMNIAQAYKVSNVPVYQEIARMIGLDRMQYYIRLLHYGEMDIHAENLDEFWLEGDSKISQFQQIYFLHRLYEQTLPLKEKTMQDMKEIMLWEQTNEYTLRAKTGWSEVGGKDAGWFVGYFEIKGNVYFFATHIEAIPKTDMEKFGSYRTDITKEILSNLSILNIH